MGYPKVITVDALLAMKFPKKTTWGSWRYIKKYSILVHKKDPYYEIDLDTCKTVKEILNWIAHIMKKIWASDEDIANLVRAFDDLLNLQGDLCCF